MEQPAAEDDGTNHLPLAHRKRQVSATQIRLTVAGARLPVGCHTLTVAATVAQRQPSTSSAVSAADLATMPLSGSWISASKQRRGTSVCAHRHFGCIDSAECPTRHQPNEHRRRLAAEADRRRMSRPMYRGYIKVVRTSVVFGGQVLGCPHRCLGAIGDADALEQAAAV